MRHFTDEYEYLIHLVKCAINDVQPDEIPEHLSFQKVFKYSVEHEIANIAFYSVEKLDKKPDKAIYDSWRLKRDFAITRDINQDFARAEIVDALHAAGIRTLEVQGTKIKPLYPRSDYRTMSDIDFIIDLENLQKASEVLETLGYKCENIEDIEVNAFRQPNINIELHTDYFPPVSEYHNCMRPPFSVESDVNELYIYNILHIAKHYFNRGCGIRRILDAYFLNLKFGEKIDKDYVNSILEKAEITDFVKDISDLADYWFGTGDYNERIGGMIGYITESALDGNYQNLVNNRIRRNYKGNTTLVKIKYMLKRLFAGGDIMYKYYPFLRKWKILYPFCWIHRFIRASVTKKRLKITDEAKAIMKADLNQKR